MLIYSTDCSTCLLSWHGLLIMVGSVCGDFSQTLWAWPWSWSSLVPNHPGSESCTSTTGALPRRCWREGRTPFFHWTASWASHCRPS